MDWMLIKMTVLSKLAYRLNVSIKIPPGLFFFLGIGKFDPKIYMEIQRNQNNQNYFEKEKLSWQPSTTWFQNLLWRKRKRQIT